MGRKLKFIGFDKIDKYIDEKENRLKLLNEKNSELLEHAVENAELSKEQLTFHEKIANLKKPKESSNYHPLYDRLKLAEELYDKGIKDPKTFFRNVATVDYNKKFENNNEATFLYEEIFPDDNPINTKPKIWYNEEENVTFTGNINELEKDIQVIEKNKGILNDDSSLREAIESYSKEEIEFNDKLTNMEYLGSASADKIHKIVEELHERGVEKLDYFKPVHFDPKGEFNYALPIFYRDESYA